MRLWELSPTSISNAIGASRRQAVFALHRNGRVSQVSFGLSLPEKAAANSDATPNCPAQWRK